MKQKHLIIALLMCFPLSAWAISPADIAQLLQNNAITQGQFSQERLLRGMNKPIKSSGSYQLIVGNALLWTLENPFPAALKITQEGIFQQQVDGSWQETQQINRQQMQLFLGLLSGKWQPLENFFTMTATGDASQWQLVLKPKGDTLNAIFNGIVLEGGDSISHISIEEAQGDKSDIYFSK